MPCVWDVDELKGKRAEMGRENLKRRLREKVGTKGERRKEDQSAFPPFPPAAFDA